MNKAGQKKAAEGIPKIRLFATDFDGVWTDNRVIFSDDGSESVLCDRSDSLGLKMLKEQRPDIAVIVISKETSAVVKARCEKLKIPYRTGIDDKITLFKEIVKEAGLGHEEVAYMGNDVNDLDCILYAGIGIAVADSDPAVIAAADYVTKRNGGRGTIREIIDIILSGSRTT